MNTIEAVCAMPTEFKRRGDASMTTLLMESGYLVAPEVVTEALLARHLRAKPELVDLWLHHSQDQRSRPGWYLKGPVGFLRRWHVGYVPDSGSWPPAEHFHTRYAACARFIKRYLESLRELVDERQGAK